MNGLHTVVTIDRVTLSRMAHEETQEAVREVKGEEPSAADKDVSKAEKDNKLSIKSGTLSPQTANIIFDNEQVAPTHIIDVEHDGGLQEKKKMSNVKKKPKIPRRADRVRC